MLRAPVRLCHRFAWTAIGGSSDFVHCSQSRQSHQAVSSLYRQCFPDWLFYRLSVHFQLLSTSPRGDAVTFSYWREAPPERDFHPPMHALSQAHESRLQAASTLEVPQAVKTRGEFGEFKR